jgi:hypothetical protein
MTPQDPTLVTRVYRSLLYPAYQRLPDPIYRLLDTFAYRNDSDLGGIGYYRQYLKWRRHIRQRSTAWDALPHKVTVILLSFKRVRNIRLIVQGLLNAPFVETIIVSNNNPEYRIEEWIRIKDGRLRVINQPKRTAPGIRFELARREHGEYFLTIDDDVFLYAHQLQMLLKALMEDPISPYGLQGENRGLPDSEEQNGWHSGLSGFAGEVDVINRVYAFTREHLEEMYRLARLLNIEVGELANGEDLLLSFSGNTKPRLVNAGRITACLSENRNDVATWATRKDFFAERSRLFVRLQAVKNLGERS